MSLMEIIKVVFGSVFVLFLPGAVWSFVFFAKKEIDFLERLALSVILSAAIVPLTVFYTNLFGLKINLITVVVQISAIILLGLVVIFFRKSKYENQA